MSNKSQHLTLEQWKVLAEYQQACTILNGMYDDPDYYNQISYCDRLLYNCTKLGVDQHDYDASDGFTTISGNEGFMVRGRIHVHPDQLEVLSKVFTYLAQLYKSSL